MALLGAVGCSAIALVLLPTASTLVFVWVFPALAARYGGWVTVAALFAVPLTFPVVHLAASQVLVGRVPPWAESPARWMRILAFGVCTALPLAFLLTNPSATGAGIVTLTWGLGLLAVVAASTPRA